MNSGLLIFDLDDTLIDTSEVYYRARTCFLGALEASGFDYSTSLEVFESTDASLMQVMSHSPERYGRSMVKAYRSLLSTLHRNEEHHVLDHIANCGRIITEVCPTTIEGAHELLTWARKRFSIALITRGDRSFQEWKLRQSGLDQYFDEVDVVTRKSTDDYERMMRKMHGVPRMTWIVGDSIKSDINPGIELGVRCILYKYTHPNYIWQQEYDAEAIGQHFTVFNLTEVRSILEENPLREI